MLRGYFILGLFLSVHLQASDSWVIDSANDWKTFRAESQGLTFENGLATPTTKSSTYRSIRKTFPEKKAVSEITVEQCAAWKNWIPTDPVGPTNLGDAPIFLSKGPNNYWLLGRYNEKTKPPDFTGEDTRLEGFTIPLKTTPWPRQYDAPGGLKKSLGGYHAWQSRDMVHWVHHGPVTETFSRWATTAEYVDGKTYIYYDFPNDQDPHVYVDEDLTDGKPGTNKGLAFKDPSDGSDCAIIRDLEGRFHLIYEDWSPINAREHSWDSPLAGHAVSRDGLGEFKILAPPVDERTTPTGTYAEYDHPHWKKEDPKNFPSNTARYEIHEPEQNAFGDWAAIAIGGQYYLFGDFHPAGKSKKKMSVAWFTSADINEPFTFCGHVGSGHPDPDIGFAEGQFYLITQTNKDFVSPGPWVEEVKVRVGVDTSNDGKINQWSDWAHVRETYKPIPGFAKQIERVPASSDLGNLPEGYGFVFEFKATDTTDNDSSPIIDRISLTFK
jgi:hypothetical protein